MEPPTSANAGVIHRTSTHPTRMYCSILFPSREPMARDRAEVSPVESPTQIAIIRNSNGTVRPIEPTAASPIVAA